MNHNVTLQDGNLTLRPLTEADIPALCDLASAHAEALKLMGTPPNTPGYYLPALTDPTQMAFVIEVDGVVAGSTRYGDIRAAHSGLEIGWTWLTPEHWRTGINRRQKQLLLAHAFEQMGMERVQLKTDILNTRSQRAIEGIGGVREGVLRSHMRRADGSMRDSVMYSITWGEWEARKTAQTKTTQTSLEMVLELEKQVWEVFKRGDAEADRRLLASDFLGVYSVGRAGRDAHAAQLQNGPTVARYTLSDEQVRELAPGLLLLSYRAEFTVPGATETYRTLVTSIWQRWGDEWLNVFSQDTELQETATEMVL